MTTAKSNASGRTRAEEAGLPLQRYFNEQYFTQQQMLSFIQQILLVMEQRPTSMLEIGKGNGFVSDFLKKSGISVTTVDINPSLKPDVVAEIHELPNHFSPDQFELVLCAEVLEHLPYNEFGTALAAIRKVSSKWTVITLPRAQRVLLDLQLNLKLPKLPRFNWKLFWSAPKSSILKEHHWEINSRPENSLHRIRMAIKQSFELVRDGRLEGNSYHHYFICKK